MNIENILKYGAGKSITISINPHIRSDKNVPEYIEIFEEMTDADKLRWTSTSDKILARIKNTIAIVEIAGDDDEYEIITSQSLAEIDSFLHKK